jgi:release factor glutamine methyltransferase
MAQSEIVSSVLAWMTQQLQGVVASPRREAELLLMAHLQCDQLYLIAHPDSVVDNIDRLEAWTQRRQQHEPIEYITEHVSFYSEIFYIKPGALIPRPETELLIDAVLKELDADFEGTLVEVGIGSGIISIILARHLPKARIIAVDISDEALHVARKNIRKFGLETRIDLRKGNLLDTIDEEIDIVVSNPPYIANDALLEKNLDYEPALALFGGSIGDEIIAMLIDQVCQRHISMFACEMGYDQQEKVNARIGSDYEVSFYKDYAKFDRGFVMKRSV